MSVEYAFNRLKQANPQGGVDEVVKTKRKFNKILSSRDEDSYGRSGGFRGVVAVVQFLYTVWGIQVLEYWICMKDGMLGHLNKRHDEARRKEDEEEPSKG